MVLATALLTACGGNSIESDFGTTETPTTSASAATTTAPVPFFFEDFISTDEIRLDVPPLWRTVTSPPEGSDTAIYAPSDNNTVAERVLLAAIPLDSTATSAEDVEQATNDLEAHFVAVVVLDTSQAVVGTDGTPAQRIQFTWEQPREAGVGWRWVVRAETKLIFITYLADLSEPELYLTLVQDMLDTARVGG
jgi:hypothetical protein